MSRFSFASLHAKEKIVQIKTFLAANPAATPIDLAVAVDLDLHTTNRYLRFLSAAIIRSESTPGSARALFDFAMKKMQVKTFSKLAKVIGIDPATVSRMISGHEKISPSMILALHEYVDIPVADIRKMMTPAYLAENGIESMRRNLAGSKSQKISKRAAGLAKARARITEFVLACAGVSTAEIAEKLHISETSARRHAIALEEEGFIVRCYPSRGAGLVMWFAFDAPLPVYDLQETKMQDKSKSSKNIGHRQAVMVDAVQLNMTRSDPLMAALFGPAKAAT